MDIENSASKQESESVIEVKASDLPLSCPLPDSAVWNMHPKVYLAIADAPDKRIQCPYCGAKYQLTN